MKRECAAGISPAGEGIKRPCLFSSYRLNVLLIGVEGFPHSGFRHFIRYVNIRGITPERQGEDGGGREDDRGQIGKKIRESNGVFATHQTGMQEDRQERDTPLFPCVVSPGVVHSLNRFAALHGNLNSCRIVRVQIEHDQRFLQDTRKRILFLKIKKQDVVLRFSVLRRALTTSSMVLDASSSSFFFFHSGIKSSR